MAQTQLGVVVRHLHRLFGTSALDEPTDHQLLDRFAAHRDEAAFEELLRRHGPLVLGVCRRLLPESHDADDVFQATFLVFVHKASSVRQGTSLGSWLYGVAYRLALKARAAAARRRVHERRRADMRQTSVTGEPAWDEVRPLLDEELARLPDRLRAPLVLCYLQGKTNAEAARELGRPPGSMSKLLARGRDLLRHRLARRGVALSSAALALLVTQNAGAAVPAALGRATLMAGLAAASGMGVIGLVSARVVGLVQGGLRDMFLTNCKLVLALVLALGALGTGAGFLAAPAAPPEAAAPEAPEEEQKAAAPAAPQPKPGLDLDGDALPAGAIARLGTVRLRHGQNVQAVAFAPDSKTVISTGHDHLARRWDVTTGRQVGSFGAQGDRDKPYSVTRWMHALAFAPDGKTLATGDHTDGWQLGSIRIWDVASASQTRVLQGHTEGVLCLAYSPDGKTLASASVDGTVRVWDPEKGAERHNLSGHEGAVRWVAFSPDGKTLASTGVDGAVRLWDPDKGTAVHSWKAHVGGADAVAFSPDGKRLASSGADMTTRLWDLSTRQELRKIQRDKPVRGAAISPDGKLVASGGTWEVLLWDPDTGKEVRRLKGAHGEVSGVTFSPDGKYVAAFAVSHSLVYVWETATGKRLGDRTGHEAAQVNRLAYSADGRVTSYCPDQSIRQWDALTGRQLRLIEAPDTINRASCLAPDGQSLACVHWNGDLRIRDLSGKELRRWKGHQGTVMVVTYSPDGKVLASGGMDQAVVLWDPATGKELRRFQAEGGPASDVLFSPDGKLLAAVVRGKPLQLWEVGSGNARPLTPPAGPVAAPGAVTGGDVESAAFSPDGRLIVTGGRDGFARLWDVANGQQVRALPGHLGWIIGLAFSRDGRTLAAGNWRNIHLWEVSTGKLRHRFQGHEADVSALAFAPDGRTLVSGASDTSVLVWDLTGRLEGGKLKTAELSQQELELAWTDLRGDDATRAYAGLWALAAAPKQALPLLREALPRAGAAEAERVGKLIAALDDDDFEKREKATDDLSRVGEQAEPALKKALEGKPSVELRRRIEYLLERLRTAGESGERPRQARALEALEVMGTPEARATLEELSKGAAEAWLTREAKAALARMGK
jgi:RNA polymerase sigma factor (sigma-70 family)